MLKNLNINLTNEKTECNLLFILHNELSFYVNHSLQQKFTSLNKKKLFRILVTNINYFNFNFILISIPIKSTPTHALYVFKFYHICHDRVMILISIINPEINYMAEFLSNSSCYSHEYR